MRIKAFSVALLLVLLASPAGAREMRLTIYDDGASCPANCDAHFVMNQADNGSRFAFRPGSSRIQPQRCALNDECTICFEESDDSCMNARYRGGGPAAGTFDFTPAFYEANCARQDIPDALRDQCDSLDDAVAGLGYSARTNCFLTPDDDQCRAAVAAAAAAQQADLPKFQRCLAIGEEAYNNEQTDPREKRTNACAYTLLKLGGSNQRRWHLLLPAACRPGTFVDRFGLDCCSRDLRFAASVHPECTTFFPR
jgi:hypothetical protein